MGQAFEDAGQANGHHNDSNDRLTDERPKHNSFDDDSQECREYKGSRKRNIERSRNLGHYAKTHKSSKGHELAGSQVENTGSFVDQDVSQRYKSINSTCCETADQNLRNNVHTIVLPGGWLCDPCAVIDVFLVVSLKNSQPVPGTRNSG